MLCAVLTSLASPALTPPPLAREFRGVWVATVDHIDWPTSKSANSAEQQAELIRIMDRAAALKLNTIIFQIRPAADALYESKIEPWSEYLTGLQGHPPAPLYDPLAFAIVQAHKRGMQLHAWFNPYRAELLSAKGPLASSHIAKTHPELVKRYGNLLWMDPGEPLVQERSLRVIEDVVRRYDIDGVHLDDYFYPYPEGGASFPDDASFRKYGAGLSRGEWRHRNVDEFISRAYREVHAAKPWVEFGISPFGIYRPGIPPGIKAGVDQFVDLASDPVKWLQQGWCDYLSPQLYWPIDQKAQSFPVLLQWWRSQNGLHRHVWPGLYTSRVLAHSKGFSAEEIVHQVIATRRDCTDPGHIHFSMKAFSDDGRSINEYLSGECYQQYALAPGSPWLNASTSGAPDLHVDTDGKVSWSGGGKDQFRNVVLAERFGSKWDVRILPGDASGATVPRSLPSGRLNAVAVARVSRTGVLGTYAVQSF